MHAMDYTWACCVSTRPPASYAKRAGSHRAQQTYVARKTSACDAWHARGRNFLRCLAPVAGFAAGRLCRKHRRDLCSQSQKTETEVTEKLAGLRNWLREVGTQGLEELRFDNSRQPGGGLAVFAERDFAPGEVLCFLPEKGILTGEPREGWNKEVRLAKSLLYEKELEAKSLFAPYIRCLPTLEELPTIHPYFWPAELDIENLMAGSVHGQRVAKEIVAEGLG